MIKEESTLIGYTQLLAFDDEAFTREVRDQEFRRMKETGKVWTRGEATTNLSPSLRKFVESRNGVQDGCDLPPVDAQYAFCVGL